MSEKEQSVIKDYKIFLGGAGIGSIVAECALRFGFEHITIVDGDKVEQSNLNRQNYTENDIGRYKAECLAERLLSINPDAQIDYHTEFLNPNNIEEMLNGHNVAINALDFKDDTPFVFDRICKERKIPVLHPYNFGWAGFVTIVDPLGHSLSELADEPKLYGCSTGIFLSLQILSKTKGVSSLKSNALIATSYPFSTSSMLSGVKNSVW